MGASPTCYREIDNHHCPFCEEKERDFHRHDNMGAYDKSQSYTPPPNNLQQDYKSSYGHTGGRNSGTPGALDKLFKGFIYAKWTSLLLIVVLAYKIFLSLRFLLHFSSSFLSLAPYVPLAILVVIDLLLLGLFIKKHKSKSNEAGKPSACGLLFIALLLWFWYLPFVVITASFRMM